MWFSKKEASAAPAVLERAPEVKEVKSSRLYAPKAVVVEPEMEIDERAEYLRVAAELGISDSPAVLNERIRVVLQEENITRYPLSKVNAYLNQELGVGKWNWAGVRECDVEHLAGWTTGEDAIPFGKKRYSGEIPLPVLLTMQKIAAKLPEVHFYISQQDEPEGDPFLLVTERGVQSYIVERWDEPGFRISDEPATPTE